MGSIVVGAKPIGWVPGFGQYYHIYIVYTNDAGHSTVYHAFPNGDNHGSFEIPLYASNSGNGDWGEVLGQVDSYDPIAGQYTPLDWNTDGSHHYTTPLVTGDDQALAPMIAAMQNRMNQINAAHVAYNPFYQNSNTFANDLLEAAGLPTIRPHDDNGPVWAPAFDADLPGAPHHQSAFWDYLRHLWGDAVNALGDWWHDLGDAFDRALERLAHHLGLENFDPTHLLSDIFGFSFAQHDPLVFDLGGHGVQLTSLTGSSVQFDLDGDGFAERVGWVSASSGLLVHDLNGNGRIDNGSELFGDAHSDGFAALASSDDNADGVIDASDSIYAELRIWQDLDQDGVTDVGELSTLADRNIISINLATVAGGGDRAGNSILLGGTFTAADGPEGETLAVAFSTDQINTRYQLPDGFLYDLDVFALPNLRGYGCVPDLWVAMTLDPTLKQMVQNLVADASDFGSLEDVVGHLTIAFIAEGQPPSYGYDMKAFDAILARWTGVDLGDEDRIQVENIAESFMNRQADHAFNNPNFYTAFEKFSTELGVRFYTQVAQLDSTNAILGLVDALKNAVPADGVAFTQTELATLIAPFLDVLDNPPTINSNLEPYSLLDFDFATDSFSGDIDGFLDAQLSSYDFDPDHPWQGYDDWYGARQTLLQIVDPDGSRLEDRHRIFTGNLDLAILRYDHETVNGTSGADTLAGDGGGYASADLMTGRAGDDTLNGGGGNDTYLFVPGSGADTVTDASGVDEVAFQGALTGSIAQFAFANGNLQDLLISFEGRSETVTIIGYFAADGAATIENVTFPDGAVSQREIRDAVYATLATAGDDSIMSSVYGTTLVGLGGDDTLVGRYGADTLAGGAGDDLLTGSGGNDTYVVALGGGQDVVLDTDDIWNGIGGFDTIAFATGIAPGDVIVTEINDGSDLVLAVRGTDDSITIQGTINDGWERVEQVVFADGTVWTHADLMSLALAPTEGDDEFYGSYDGETVSGGAGDDVIDARNGNDVLVGGTGDDLLSGSGGDDIYQFAPGDGQDIVRDDVNVWSGRGGFDTIDLAGGIAPEDVTVTQADNGHDLVLTFAGSDDSVTLDDTINDGYQRIEQVRFEDGTIWSYADLMALALAPTSGDDTFYGGYDAETIEGGDGDDVIDARDGNDVLVGGAGDDILSGSGGDDTYVFNPGDGHDVVREEVDIWSGHGGFDIIAFGEGIDPDDVVVTQGNNGRDFVLSIAGTSDRITIEDGMIDVYDYIEEVHFADGTIWSRDEMFARSLGATPGADTLLGDSGNNVLDGLAGNDTIDGRWGNDILIGGTGNDLMIGSGGDDTYRFGLGGGQDVVRDYGDWWNGNGGFDIVELGSGIAPSDVTVTEINSGGDLRLSFAGTSDTLTLNGTINDGNYRIEQVVFADGTIWSHADLMALALAPTSGNDTFWGGYDSETISGGGGNDTIDGRWGNDILIGGAGNDLLIGSGGDDTYRFGLGDGQDVVRDLGDWWNGTGGFDTIVLDAGIAPSDITVVEANSGNDLVLSIAGTTDTITISGTINNSDYRIERLTFADGTIWSHADLLTLALAPTSGNDTFWGSYDSETISGGAGNDTIDGRWGNDVLIGGTGNDLLIGSGGNDTYRFGLGDGHDVVRDIGDWWNGAGGYDVVELGAGIAPADVTVGTADSGGSYVLYVGGGDDSIVLTGAATWGSDYAIEEIHFANGTTWSPSTLASLAVASSNGADTLSGDANDNLIRGLGGDDHLSGGAGADTLAGDGGADTFVFANGDTGTGSSADRITDFVSGSDRIDLGAIDANSATAGDQTFAFIGSSAFSGTAGELRFMTSGSDTWLQMDTDGDGTADMAIVLAGNVTPLATDFVL